jgi:hypothetical protein
VGAFEELGVGLTLGIVVVRRIFGGICACAMNTVGVDRGDHWDRMKAHEGSSSSFATALCRYYTGELKQELKGTVNLMDVLEIRAAVPSDQSPLRFDISLNSNRT